MRRTNYISLARPGWLAQCAPNFHLNLLLRVIVDPDGNKTVFSRALLGRNHHTARLRERTKARTGKRLRCQSHLMVLDKM